MTGPHPEETTLGLHFLGELDPVTTNDVHQHLAACPPCRERADEVVDAVASLALLSLDDDQRKRHVAPGPLRSATPGGRARPRGRRRRLLRLGGLLALVLVVAGLGLGALLRGPSTGDPAVVTAAASAVDGRSGAEMSVVATGGDKGVTVRATVSGLEAGTGYVLYAVTSDGQSRAVERWTGGTGVREIGGLLEGVVIDELEFLSVSRDPSGVVVTVHLPEPSESPSPAEGD